MAKGVVLRPDDEVNAARARAPVATAADAPTGEADKTVIMGAASTAPAAAAQASAGKPDFDATVVNSPVPPARSPGYDAGQTAGGGDPDFIKTDIFQRPPGRGPDSGAGNGI